MVSMTSVGTVQSQQLHPQGERGPNTWTTVCCFSKVISSKLDRKRAAGRWIITHMKCQLDPYAVIHNTRSLFLFVYFFLSCFFLLLFWGIEENDNNQRERQQALIYWEPGTQARSPTHVLESQPLKPLTRRLSRKLEQGAASGLMTHACPGKPVKALVTAHEHRRFPITVSIVYIPCQ